jgi:hypothetical protein
MDEHIKEQLMSLGQLGTRKKEVYTLMDLCCILKHDA